jgi:ferredoxin
MSYFINEKCTLCGACLIECPTASILVGTTQYYIDADTCNDHAACVAVCPVDAIAILKITPSKKEAQSEKEEDEEAAK